METRSQVIHGIEQLKWVVVSVGEHSILYIPFVELHTSQGLSQRDLVDMTLAVSMYLCKAHLKEKLYPLMAGTQSSSLSDARKSRWAGQVLDGFADVDLNTL